MTTEKRINWTNQEIIYHIYPLGMLGAEKKNSFSGHITNRLPELMNWTRYLKDLGISCIYLGPVFSSESHGYDTEDYCKVDQRLGTNADLKALVEYFHQHDIKTILDGVFNHTGRSFFAFRDLLEAGKNSEYCDWIKGLDFNTDSPYNDGFSYETWNDHYNLVKLNQDNENVRDYFKSVIDFWIDNFDIDGIRFDAADVMNRNFLAELSRHAKSKKNEFWMVGEVIHGDYRLWTNEARLDSVTNYEAYKSLYSSLNDKNYYELAWTLNRQFGDGGMYNNLSLYNFCDNHDVNRISSILNDSSYIFPLYLALFTIPGIPVIYYGSENGIPGKRDNHSDHQLRPVYTISEANNQNDIRDVIARLVKIRKENPALQTGNYRQEFLAHQQIAYSRDGGNQKLLIVLNSSKEFASVQHHQLHGSYYDILNNEWCLCDGKIQVNPNWGRIIKLK